MPVVVGNKPLEQEKYIPGVQKYASDVVNHAMRMAQQQAINQFSYRDILYLLNQHWRYCYERINQIDTGYYSRTVKLEQELTHLPAYVFGSLSVYRSKDPLGYSRQVYTHSGEKDIRTFNTFYISGSDLYVWDVNKHREPVWLSYTPQPPYLFFTLHNRDPVIIEERDRPAGIQYDEDAEGNPDYSSPKPLKEQKSKYWKYGIYELRFHDPNTVYPNPFYTAPNAVHYTIDGDLIHSQAVAPTYEFEDHDVDFYKGKEFWLHHMGNPENLKFNITELIYRGAYDDASFIGEAYDVVALMFDFPYAFVSYRHRATGEYHSVILRDLLSSATRYKYNAFDFTGRDTKVKFLDAKYNDDTGKGVVIEDYEDIYEYEDEEGEKEDKPKIKELGWTPDSLVTYPFDCVFDYLVANMAKRFANKNESTIMDIEDALASAEREMNLFLKRDKNPWYRIQNVTSPTISSII